jgi:hypothetical protein
MTRTRSITLSEELCRRLEERLGSPERPDVEAILTYVTKELLKDEAVELDEREERLIKNRLEELGYL